MSDPLSIATGVVGLITAATQISLILAKFTRSTIAAPHQAQVVLAEVSDVGGILSHLESFLLGPASADRSRTSLLKVEKVVTIVSGCVLTFSELEKLLDDLKTEDLDVLDRVRWARKESAIEGLIQRLQNHKASLSLVLNILNGFVLLRQMALFLRLLKFQRYTINEAKVSVDRLHELVEQCYSEMFSRVQTLEILNLQKNSNADLILGGVMESLATLQEHPPDSSKGEAMDSEPIKYGFTDDLKSSRVYRRTQAFRSSIISALTNSVYSRGWSFISELSMAEVSNISVIGLGITEQETFNPKRSSQTWSAQPSDRTSGGPYTNYRDGQFSQLSKVERKSLVATNPATAEEGYTQKQQHGLHAARSLPLINQPKHHDSKSRPQLLYRGGIRAIGTHELAPAHHSPLADPSDPPSPPQPSSTSSQSHEPVEDEQTHPCNGCGNILEEGKALKLGEYD